MTQPRPGDGPPPPPWERTARRRDRLIVAGALAGTLVIGVPLGLVAWNLANAFDDAAPRGTSGTDEAPPPSTSPGEAPEFPTVDLDELSGADETYGRLFTHVARSETVMVTTQLEIAAAVSGADRDDPDVAGDLAAAVAEAAGDGQRELQAIRREVATTVEDATARGIRDSYLAHLDAWVRFFVAIEERPELLATPEGDAPFALAIRTTGEDFADRVAGDLPRDLDADVTALVDAIIEEGFQDAADPTDRETV